MFIEWPADAFPAPYSPITIGIVGTDPFGSAIDLTVRDKRIDNRRLVVKRLQWNQDIRQCHIVFLSAVDGAQDRRTGPARRRTADPDRRRHGRSCAAWRDRELSGWMTTKCASTSIVEAANRARLKISSQLLNVARIVRGPGPATR